ncbi:MipA/OmpV family protein [Bradyrhizobium sp.]|uniref:MipA/OmpV family protein n=1 Tax=Bradyrhizobium sp. TaxID=376 RepID=UPI0025B7FF63|nr:MipA/OmpV family protein [Bradyrhizobium sp.]MCA3254083.1 MipA/OmpV family protein [Alphaproteobacteria bacterium]MCA3566510.1 MipA/OmpV family protein [Bradyrhizobium sp.]
MTLACTLSRALRMAGAVTATTLLVWLPATSATAQIVDDTPAPAARDGLSGFLALGVAAIPRYEGAKDHRSFPAAFGQLRYGDRYAELLGTSLRVNVIDSPRIAAGPVVSLTFGRGAKGVPAQIRALGRIGDAVEAGGFAALTFPGVAKAGDALSITVEAVTDVSGTHDGTIGSLTATYRLPVGDRLSLTADVRMSAASDGYARRYFGVGAAGATASGLPAFAAGGGLRDVGGGVTAAYALDRRWSLVGFANYRRIGGDFAASPVVRIAGDRDQMIAGAGVGLSF